MNLLTDMDSSTDTKKILLSKAKFAQQLLFCVAILQLLLVKVFKSETTSFHYLSQKIQNLKKNLNIQLQELGAKIQLNSALKVNRRTDTRMDFSTC